MNPAPKIVGRLPFYAGLLLLAGSLGEAHAKDIDVTRPITLGDTAPEIDWNDPTLRLAGITDWFRLPSFSGFGASMEVPPPDNLIRRLNAPYLQHLKAMARRMVILGRSRLERCADQSGAPVDPKISCLDAFTFEVSSTLNKDLSQSITGLRLYMAHWGFMSVGTYDRFEISPEGTVAYKEAEQLSPAGQDSLLRQLDFWIRVPEATIQ